MVEAEGSVCSDSIRKRTMDSMSKGDKMEGIEVLLEDTSLFNVSLPIDRHREKAATVCVKDTQPSLGNSNGAKENSIRSLDSSPAFSYAIGQM